MASPRTPWSSSRRWVRAGVRAKSGVRFRALAPADPPTVVQFDEGRADFPVDEELGLDQEELSRFLLTHSMHLVTEFNSQVSWATGTGADCRRGSQR